MTYEYEYGHDYNGDGYLEPWEVESAGYDSSLGGYDSGLGYGGALDGGLGYELEGGLGYGARYVDDRGVGGYDAYDDNCESSRRSAHRRLMDGPADLGDGTLGLGGHDACGGGESDLLYNDTRFLECARLPFNGPAPP